MKNLKFELTKRRFLHPVVAHFESEQAPLGIRLANTITGYMGSWKFLVLQSFLVGAWIFLNAAPWFKHFDPYPFILLNLAFSTQAAYAAPLILMAANVAAAKDRELWDNDYATNQKTYQKIEDLEQQIQLLIANQQQLLELVGQQNPHQKEENS